MRLRATRGLAACLRQRVWAFGSLAFCASPRSWYPFSAPAFLPLRRHCACPLAFSLTQARYLALECKILSHRLVPAQEAPILPSSFPSPFERPYSLSPPSIRASAHSPSLSSCTSNRSRCACERIAKVSKMFFHSIITEYFANLMLILNDYLTGPLNHTLSLSLSISHPLSLSLSLSSLSLPLSTPPHSLSAVNHC